MLHTYDSFLELYKIIPHDIMEIEWERDRKRVRARKV